MKRFQAPSSELRRPGVTTFVARLARLACLARLALAFGVLVSAAHVEEAIAKGKSGAKGPIKYQTADRLFIGVGSDKGLKVGTRIRLWRKGRRKAGTCTLDRVSSHHASCQRTHMPGAVRFTTRDKVKVEKREVAPRPVRRTQAEIDELKASIDAVILPKVTYTAAQIAARRQAYSLPIFLSLTSQSWMRPAIGENGRSQHQQRLSITVSRARLFVDGLTASVRADLIGSFLRPEESAFLPQRKILVEVYETAIDYRPENGELQATAGRFYPRNAPGLPVLDGAQAGMRLLENQAEVGAYLGSAADPRSMLPVDNATSADGSYRVNGLLGGAYQTFRYVKDDLRVYQRARMGIESDMDVETAHGSADVTGSLGYGTMLMANAGARLVVPLLEAEGVDKTPRLDLFYADVRLRPLESLTVDGAYRFGRTVFQNFVNARSGDPSVHRFYLSGGMKLLNLFEAGLRTDAFIDGNLADTDMGLGPYLSVPRLMSGLLSARISMRQTWASPQQDGDLTLFSGARSGYATVGLHPMHGYHFDLQASYFEMPFFGSDDKLVGGAHREVGLSLGGRAEINHWLQLRARLRGQKVAGGFDGFERAEPWGVYANFGIEGHWE